MHLGEHHLQLALIHPQIAPNTGNVARLCVATGTSLHLVRPLGFVLDDKRLRRSAMDYWPRLKLTVHDDEASFFAAIDPANVWLFEIDGRRDLWDAPFRDGDCLIFGSETNGLSASARERFSDRVVRIPQVKEERSLNLSSSAAIATYEALRRIRSVEPPVFAPHVRGRNNAGSP